MLHKFVFGCVFLSLHINCFAQNELEISDTSELHQLYEELALRAYVDSLESTFQYQYGKVVLGIDSMAILNVPKGYKYLDSLNSKTVLEYFWGNAPAPTLGLLFPDSANPLDADFTFAIDLTFTNEGYVDDEQAKEIDYEDLLELMKQDADMVNEIRKEQGYPEIRLLGWAAQPKYDDINKKLHWAKEYQVDHDTINTLNYNIRVLGRYGFINLNAIGNMDILDLVQQDLDKILKSVSFKDGHRYEDYNPKTDLKADYGLDGLILGKVIRRSGAFSFLGKNYNIIFFVILVLVFAIGKRFIKIGKKAV
ncbi:MAG: DUF2167 domain-containing protein [Flavobacteriales bacterium]|nr:DUF2167 domain-containing protein [Flavobacteriales bacterium]